MFTVKIIQSNSGSSYNFSAVISGRSPSGTWYNCVSVRPLASVLIFALRNKFLTVGQAKVATSAYEAFELGYLREGTDEVVVSRAHQLAYAKAVCLDMANKGYQQPAKVKDIRVVGNEGMGNHKLRANWQGQLIADPVL